MPPPNFEKEAVKALRDSGANLSMTGALLAVEAVIEALKRRHNATLRMVHKHVCGCKESADGCPGQKAVKELTVKP